MKSPRFFLFALALSTLPSFASTRTLWDPTLDSLTENFEEMYSFKDHKRELFGWDLATEMNQVRDRLSNVDPSDSQAARDALLPFYHSTRDIHVGARFDTSSDYSNTRLPFVVRSADYEHYFFVNIDRKAMPSEIFPLEIGDELLSVDGKPVKEWVAEYLPLTLAQERTQHALAERLAFSRSESVGRPLKFGNATFEVRRQATQKTETYTAAWIETKKEAPKSDKAKKQLPKKGVLAFLDENEFGTEGEKDAGGEFPIQGYGVRGAKKPFFDTLGTIVWQTSDTDPFYAYVSKLPNGKKLGFIRVPTYYPDDIKTVMVPAFRAIVDRFVDENISVMVYDQANNGGGSFLYTHDLLGSLIDRPVEEPLRTQWIVNEMHHEMGVNWADLKNMAEKALVNRAAFEKIQNLFDDKILDTDFLKNYIKLCDHMLGFIKSANPPRLAPAYKFEGQDWIKPSPVGKHYTGPLVVLVNELSISSADMSAAFFQDLGRAKLFGSQTSGAGAYVTAFDAPKDNPFQLVSTSISYSKFIRKNGQPIENNGVVPDVKYEVTNDDLQNGMKGYHDALLELLLTY